MWGLFEELLENILLKIFLWWGFLKLKTKFLVKHTEFEFWICYKFIVCLWVKVFLCFRTFMSSFWKCCCYIIQSQRSLSRPMNLLFISHWGLCLSRKGTQQGARRFVFINTIYIDCYQPIRRKNRQNPWMWSFGTHVAQGSQSRLHTEISEGTLN